MNFGQIIMKYRRELGLTQEGLAQKLGVTNQAVSKWESDQSCPDVALLPAIADLFGITIDQLFGREPKAVACPAQPELPWPDDDTLRVVLYVGHRYARAVPAANEIHICIEGRALNVHSEVSVNCGTVNGDLTAGGDVKCDAVNGGIQAGGDVKCDTVNGSVNAGGSVACDCVEGNVHAGGDVSCDEISGSITAGGDVHCDHWER